MSFKISVKKILIVLVSIVFAVIILAGVAAYAFVSKIQVSDAKNNSQTTAVSAAAAIPQINNQVNVLLLGTDDGDPDNPSGPRRSDTMIVASIHPDDKTVNLLSIPRDSKVYIPGHGSDKITHAFFYGGANLAVRTVEDNFQIPINYYVVIDWQAFIKVVDILGGVNLNVEQEMNYEDPYENLYIHLNKGYQHLDGKKAGQYVRFRHDELGDIGRVERQERFIKAMTGQMLQAGTILKLPVLMTSISNYVQTDMNTTTMIKIANVLKDMKADSLHADMVPGDPAMIDDISYWIPNMAETQKIVKSKFIGQ